MSGVTLTDQYTITEPWHQTIVDGYAEGIRAGTSKCVAVLHSE